MKKLYLISLFFLINNLIFGCTVIPDSFCQTMAINNDDVILTGKISSMDSDGLDFEIIDVLRGDETRENIRIWDGTDFDCNGIWSMAVSGMGEIDDTIIVILPKVIELENEWEVLGDYRRPNYFGRTTELEISNGNVVGFIRGDAIAPPEYKLLEISYKIFKENLETNSGCSQLVDLKELNKELNVRVTNPVGSEIIIINENTETLIHVRIFDSNGIEILNKDIDKEVNRLNISKYPKGIYFVRLEGKNANFTTRKVIKM